MVEASLRAQVFYRLAREGAHPRGDHGAMAMSGRSLKAKKTNRLRRSEGQGSFESAPARFSIKMRRKDLPVRRHVAGMSGGPSGRRISKRADMRIGEAIFRERGREGVG